MEEINKYIGRRIREAREDMGWKQTDLAKRLSYSPMAISHFEKATRPIKVRELFNLARITN